MTLALPHPNPFARLRVIFHRDNYSGFVHIMKFGLPALSIILLGIVVIWARLTTQTDGFRIGYAAITADSVKNLRMVNARYYGIDEANNPFSITADSGAQRSADSDLIDMEFPKADFVSHSGSAIIITADHGVYHQHSQVLDLQGNVSLYHELGYELHTEIAHIDLKTSAANGELPVEGHGPQGRLKGTGFRIIEKGEQIIVNGRSSLSLQGGAKNHDGGKHR